MPRVYLRSNAVDDPLGRRLYRIFLLAILFAVLLMKGFLWTSFILAMLLYLYEILVGLVPAEESIEIPDVEPQPRRGGRRWRWKPEGPE